ncbi:MAG: DUF2288 domain-containing protein [Methylococcales bacterium]|nr:DUF2288 domain-containing protein [Methylococcales bacterium]
MTQTDDLITRKKLNLETSRMPWQELQRFFAKGDAIFVSSDLDLVDVAYQFSQDNKTQVNTWMINHKIGKVTESQAQQWINKDSLVWAVVIKPWVLVQDKN